LYGQEITPQKVSSHTGENATFAAQVAGPVNSKRQSQMAQIP